MRGPSPTLTDRPTVWARIHHDLRQPIQSMHLLTHIMMLADDPVQRKKASRSMEASLENLQAMLDDLSLLGRLEAGIEVPSPVQLSLPEFLKQTASSEQTRAVVDGLTVKTRATPVTVLADRRLLTKLVVGLLGSAAKDSSASEIVMGGRQNGDGACIEVDYEGPPLNDAMRQANFIETRHVSGGEMHSRTTAGFAMLSAFARLQDYVLEVETVSQSRQRLQLLIPKMAERPMQVG